jgi:hypothetical protein
LHPLVDWDEAQYASIGELVRAGGRLYRDGGVDFKPPGIYWTYAAVFELCGRYAMWAVHALALLVAIATAWLAARIAVQIARPVAASTTTPRAATIAGIACGCFLSYPRMLGANTELFMMLPLAAMTLLAIRARDRQRWWAHSLACGALLAVATGYKQSALPSGVVIAAAAIGARHALARIAVAAGGFIAAAAVGVLAVWRLGSLDQMWHWCVDRIVGSYGGTGFSGATFAKLVVGFGPFAASTAILWLAGALAVRHVRAANAGERIVWVWLAISVASAFAPLRFYGHYFVQIVAPLAVIAACELDRRWSTWRGVAVAAIALPAAASLVYASLVEPLTDHVGAMSPDLTAPAAWIRTHTRDDDRIFVWDTVAALYVLSDRLPASRFVGFMRGAPRDQDVPPAAGWDVGPEVWPALAEDFAAHPPAVVVDASTADYLDFGHYPMSRFPAVLALVSRDYARCAVVERLTIYCRSSR